MSFTLYGKNNSRVSLTNTSNIKEQALCKCCTKSLVACLHLQPMSHCFKLETISVI